MLRLDFHGRFPPMKTLERFPCRCHAAPRHSWAFSPNENATAHLSRIPSNREIAPLHTFPGYPATGKSLHCTLRQHMEGREQRSNREDHKVQDELKNNRDHTLHRSPLLGAISLLPGIPERACGGVFLVKNAHRRRAAGLHLQENCSNGNATRGDQGINASKMAKRCSSSHCMPAFSFALRKAAQALEGLPVAVMGAAQTRLRWVNASGAAQRLSP